MAACLKKPFSRTDFCRTNTSRSGPKLPLQVSIVPCSPQHLHAFRRINTLLLPLRYPEKFYKDILSEPEVAALTWLAIWHDQDRTEGPEQEGKVVGGIRCRVEQSTDDVIRKSLYIQTLTLLSPYRQLAIASALLSKVVDVALQQHGVSVVYAHVWEQNTDALEWYIRRGFSLGEKIEGYYTRLRPGGARIVRKVLSVNDLLSHHPACWTSSDELEKAKTVTRTSGG